MIKYIPVVLCVKCSKNAYIVRRMQGSKRWIEAQCHGEVAKFQFVDNPGDVVRWEPGVKQ